MGRTLLLRTTKKVELTADGEALAGFARDIIAANDRALGFFAAEGVLRGRLRLGVSDDLVLSRLPEILGAFRARHRQVDVHLSVGLSARLYDMLDGNALDLLVAKRPAGDGRGTPLWRERLVWYGETAADMGAPVPLVVFEGASITRKLAIAALNEAGRALADRVQQRQPRRRDRGGAGGLRRDRAVAAAGTLRNGRRTSSTCRHWARLSS